MAPARPGPCLAVPARAIPAALLVLALRCVPATAQERPLLTPQRDVDVLYRMAGETMTQRLRWSQAARTLRVDPPGSALYMLVDYATKRMQWVADGRREVMDVPAPEGAGALVGEGNGAYARLGADTVAGLPCTDWRTNDARGMPMTLCFTADGVLLQVALQGQVVLQASSVSYAPQPPDGFRPPPAYRHVPPPAPPAPGPPAGAQGGASQGGPPGATPGPSATP